MARRKVFRHQRSRKAGLPPGTLLATHQGPSAPLHMRVIAYDVAGVREQTLNDAARCRELLTPGGVTWIDVDGVPDAAVLEEFGRRFHLHPLVLEDILNTDQRPKIEDYGDYLFLVLRMLTHNGGEIVSEQVSLVLGPGYVISFQEALKPGDVFDPVRQRIRSGGMLRGRGADFLAYALMDVIVDNYFGILERLGEEVEMLEESLVTSPNPDILGAIHRLKREMIFLRRSVWPLREVANAIAWEGTALIDASTRLYFRDVHDHAIQVMDTIETLREMLTGMLDVYLSSVSYRMNEIMKVLTIIATIFIPLTFLVGVYGMNFEFMPELGWRWAYPLLWLAMLGIAAVMLLYFRRNRWI